MQKRLLRGLWNLRDCMVNKEKVKRQSVMEFLQEKGIDTSAVLFQKEQEKQFKEKKM